MHQKFREVWEGSLGIHFYNKLRVLIHVNIPARDSLQETLQHLILQFEGKKIIYTWELFSSCKVGL
jgi:hypothetical protein